MRLALVGGPDIGLRQQMVSLLSEDFDVHVFGSDNSARARVLEAGAAFHLYALDRAAKPWADLRTVLRLRQAFRAVRPDIVHAYDSKPAALARLAAWMAGVPVIIGTLPGMGSLYSDDRVATRVKRGIYETLQGAASRLSYLTIVQNADDLLELTKRRVIPAARARVIPGSGIDAERFRPGRLDGEADAVLRRTMGAGAEQLLVTMITRVIRSKGVLDLAGAAEELARIRPGLFKVVLVGSLDSSTDDALTPAELARLRKAVSWEGPREDIADVMSASDAFVLPTYYREGIPRALMEAASSGLPLIATDMPGCREVVIAGVTGIRVPPRDPEALAQAIASLEDPALRARLGGAARRLVQERFDIRIICTELAQVYAEAVRHAQMRVSGTS